jgi:hypothetical protein
VTVSDSTRRRQSAAEAAARRLADAITAKATPTGRSWLLGTVSAVHAGAGTDGGDVVEITIGDDVFEAPHGKSYVPTVGDVALIVLLNGSPAVVDGLVGFPTF